MKLGLIAGETVLSFSPLYFRRIYGLPYEVYHPTDISTLRNEIKQRGWIGLNVTTPYKDTIFSLLDEASPEAAAIQAANAVSILPDGRWVGYNTDFLAARYLLSEFSLVYQPWQRLIVLGTGGAARAVAYAHASLFPEIPITFISRQPARVLAFPSPHTVWGYEECAGRLREERILLVQATPLGSFPTAFRQIPPFPLFLLNDKWLVWDLIYSPNPTLFLQLAHERGAQIEGGILFLRKQADYALELWSDLWVKYYRRRSSALS